MLRTRHHGPTRAGRDTRASLEARAGRDTRAGLEARAGLTTSAGLATRVPGLTRAVASAALAVTAAVTTATLAAPGAGAVVNGTPSEPAPWSVQITTFHAAPGAPCSGVVVAPRWVATAAHCGPTDPGAYTLAFGNWAPVPGGFGFSAPAATPAVVGSLGAGDTGSLGRHTPVSAHHAPTGDLMLLELAHPAPAPAVQRAAVDPEAGTTLRFHGFGETEFFGLRSPQLLTGLTRLDEMEPRTDSWAGRNHTVRGGYAPGDSGAPIFHGDQLVGLHLISDRAQRQPDGTLPATYQSIPAQNAWIDSVIAEG